MIQRHRQALKTAFRAAFKAHAYEEVETPVLVPCPGTELYLDYFQSTWVDHRNQEHQVWLRSSPELHMKQLLSKGYERIFQIGPCFRNGGELSRWHHPEFTMLEFYHKDISFDEFISFNISLLQEVRDRFNADFPAIKLPQARRLSMQEAFAECGITLIDGDPELAARSKALKLGSITGKEDFETAYFKILIEVIEPKLNGLVILYDYPPSQAALANIEGGLAKRFEIYLHGIELSNAFLELTDPRINRLRLASTTQARKAIGKSLCGDDPGFHKSLTQGIGQCCGQALGFDRFLAVLMGQNALAPTIDFADRPPFSEP